MTIITVPSNSLTLLSLTSSTYPRLVTIYLKFHKRRNKGEKSKKNKSKKSKIKNQKRNWENLETELDQRNFTDIGDGLVEDVLDGVVVQEIGLLRVFGRRLCFLLLHFPRAEMGLWTSGGLCVCFGGFEVFVWKSIQRLSQASVAGVVEMYTPGVRNAHLEKYGRVFRQN